MECHTKDKAWDEHGCSPQQILNDMKIRGAGEHQRDGPRYGDVKFAAEKLPRRNSSAPGEEAAERRSNDGEALVYPHSFSNTLIRPFIGSNLEAALTPHKE